MMCGSGRSMVVMSSMVALVLRRYGSGQWKGVIASGEGGTGPTDPFAGLFDDDVGGGEGNAEVRRGAISTTMNGGDSGCFQQVHRELTVVTDEFAGGGG